MPRARPGSARTRSRNRIRKQARGFFGSNRKSPYRAYDAVYRAGVYAFRDRRARKRDMRALWITRITAAAKMRGTRYSRLVNGLKLAGVILNRKMLSQIAIEDPALFDRIVQVAMAKSTAQPSRAEAA